MSRLGAEGIPASRREFLLYWAGFLIVVLGVVLILISISGLLIDVLSYRCWYPVLSPLLGVQEPPNPTRAPSISFYCENPAIGIVRFVFNLLTALIFAAAGLYMMLNGKKR